ncbi:MAG TPA: helix-turn-helix domain-containing protein [Bryobacteraceae bacterium]|nr:helix-turn-helix domain-containing protein [Bryobacteraceae bacterium]
MAVTGVETVEREGRLRQIDRIVSSDLLHGSESLCRLLRYLAEHSINHPGVGVKEYQIATEVFKRAPDFDPRMDSTVRVQTGRLRSKLSEYYAHPGVEDAWVVEIPKGVYTIVFHPRTAENAVEAPVAHAETGPPAPASQAASTRLWFVTVIVLAVLLAISVTLLVSRVPMRAPDTAAAASIATGPLADFWKSFVDDSDEPWVVFSNAEFVGRPETGMHYFNAGVDNPSQILDHYTGVGEVLGIHELDRVFGALHHGLRVKRGRLLSLDDAKNNDLIFIGSPSENLTLREIPTTQDFVFKRVEAGPRKGDLEIRNAQPRAGEGQAFLSTANLPLTEDYAVLGVMPGLNPAKMVIVLAGLTTLGTQAAVEYVTRDNTVEQLLKQAGENRSGGVAPFEAVIHVKVSRGVPVQSDLVALHKRH